MLPNFPKIRELIVAEMTSMIKGDKPNAKDALATIVEQGNELLKKAP